MQFIEEALFIPKSELDEIRKRCEVTTPGPWIWHWKNPGPSLDPYVVIIAPRRSGHIEDLGSFISLSTDCSEARENAEFISRAKEDILKLVDAIEQIQGRLCEPFEEAPF